MHRPLGMKVGIIGTGYVGLITGACFARLGHEVTCVDVVPEKVRQINEKKPPIYEEGLEELLKSVKLKATLDVSEVADCDAVFIAVPTPMKESGEMDTRFILSAVESLAPHIPKKWKVIVIKSTVVPGTTESLIPVLPGKPGKDYGLAMNPEFLREGKAIEDFTHPDRIVIGAFDRKSGDTVEKLYEKIDAKKIRTDIRTAEMIKYAANSFLATKISFINEIANICTRLGIDVETVAEAIGLDRRISPHFLSAGPGFGGSCFPKDVHAIISKAESVGYTPELLLSVLDVNDRQPLQVLDWLGRELPSVQKKKIALLGLAFKPGTDDIRESRSIILADKLLEEGADVVAFDPQAKYGKVKQSDLRGALKDAYAVIIMTDWPEIRDLDLKDAAKLVKNGLILDARRAISPEAAKKAGFRYYAIGYPLP